MQVIDCDCGTTLQAANVDDLVKCTREHLDEKHPDSEMSEDELRSFVESKSYVATDS